ncbi:MAG: hypothetical protein U1F87_06690 [Kiritimatiellia bacterium]
MNNEINPEAIQQIANEIFSGRKIQAIKLYREYSGKDLKAAKDFVESLEAELRAKQPGKFTASPAGKGCLVMLAVLGLGAMTVAATLDRVLRG